MNKTITQFPLRAASLLAVLVFTILTAPTELRAGDVYTVTTIAKYEDSNGNLVDGGGTLTASKTSGESGTMVVLVATPAQGFIFDRWSTERGDDLGYLLKNQSAPQVGMAKTFFKLYSDITVTAIFSQNSHHTVRAQANPLGAGTVLLSKDETNWSSQVTANPGETVYFKSTPASGYTLGNSAGIEPVNGGPSILCQTQSGHNPYFTMPDDDVIVTVGFNTSGISSMSNVTVNTVWVHYDSNVDNFVVDAVNIGGTASASPDTNVPLGKEVTLTATPNYFQGFQFLRWNVSPGDTYIANPYSATTTMQMPNSNVTVMAYFWLPSVLTLNEDNGFTADMASAFNGKSGQFGRSFTANVASTICLPFNYTPASTVGTFYEFVGVDMTGSDWVVTMQDANVTTNNPLQAHKPYLFKPADTGPVTFSGTVTSSAATAGTTTVGDWTFTGTYAEKRWEANNSEIGTIFGFATGQGYGGKYASTAAGEFIRLNSGGIMPFRAYLKYNGTLARTRGEGGLPERMTVRLVDADGEIDGIGEINLSTGEVTFDSRAWYDLNGRRLEGQPREKGVYINGNKKVVIK